MVAVLLAVTVGGAYLGAVVVARHRAQSAADLAALAGATRVPAGTPQACALAADVARAMRAGTARCVVEDLDVVVTIDAGVGTWGTVHAAARAGPG
ncbi:flp pilus-assembly TadE/G-like family protein [Candidatus Mycobacterium wuenschmannii]|uniref:Flp pilus-assembly TadE/G-like family protein n=1 Tax=Candidatus Mycobacterium wuenschmannii TaxID=3027808 RepID=A0ABY8VRZ0_9MYCO|nr:Rv3654c family TadE-like protein [Candidatus Mycobacterium wuenschmannii]WIM86400.1 flp pilus-assembly TadE/G-like family protein [Candidatus Mycobacterium wuenschmannii]